MTGCWDRQEINNLAIVLAAGIDQAPGDKIRLTLQIARPKAFGGGGEQAGGAPQENNVWVISQTGKTVLEAQRYLEAKISRSIYWGHTVILVFGENIAKEGVRKATNFFTRVPSPRITIWTLVTKGTAETLLNSHSQLENTSAQSAGAIIRAGVGIPVMLKELSITLATNGVNPVLPRVELTTSGTPQGPGMKESIPAAGNNQQEVNPVHAEITVTGTGVFKDEKLVGWLDIPETRGLLWLKNQMKEGVITVPSIKEQNDVISINLTRGNTKIEPFYDGQNILFNIKIKMEGELWEQQSSEDLNNPKVIKAIENKVARAIENRTRSVLEKAQLEYGVDIFGFGEEFHRKYKKEWAAFEDRWDEEFAAADFNISVEAHIRHTGLNIGRLSKK